MSRQIYLQYCEVTDKAQYSPAQKRVRYQVSPSQASTSGAGTLVPCHPGSPIPVGYRSEGSLTVENPVHLWTGKYLIDR